MKVATSLGELFVRWQYGTCDKQVRQAEGELTVKQDCTSCIITDEKREEVATVKITRWFKDAPDKLLARKIAFEMAIKAFNKKDRKAFWDAFMGNVRVSSDSRLARSEGKSEKVG